MKQFSKPPKEINAGLLEGADGALYGTTALGGAKDKGTIFKLVPDGLGEYTLALLHTFSNGADGSVPYKNELVQAPNGALFGTAWEGGGTANCGVLFQLNAEGSFFGVVHAFQGPEGCHPARIVLSTDGWIYGITSGGGVNERGVVFRAAVDGSSFAVQYSFDGAGGGAVWPNCLMQATDGALYGTTEAGGDVGYGTVFKLQPDGSGFGILRSFANANGDRPLSVIQGSDGALYGTTQQGGANGAGTVFRILTNGAGFTVLHSFEGPYDGPGAGYPEGGLLQLPEGTLVGTTAQGGTNGLGTLFKIETDGSGFVILRSFDDPTGGIPAYAIIALADGSLCGSVRQGGAGRFGAIYTIQPDGSAYRLAHSFAAPEGLFPAGLLRASTGSIYGIANEGGAHGFGSLFRMETDGSEFSVLHDFDRVSGAYPAGRLIEAANGALYGTTTGGGLGYVPNSSWGYGTLFRIDPDGSGFAVAHQFDGVDGAVPYGPMLEASDGALYGSTFSGGQWNTGTLFMMQLNGTGFSTLHSFSSGPVASLVESPAGTIYGIEGHVVYKREPDGLGGFAFTTVHDFGTQWPRALTVADGVVYGINGWDQTSYGSVFRLLGNGVSTLHAFGGPDGRYPEGLVGGQDGILYGVTGQGGASDRGTVFEVNQNGSGFAVLRSFDGETGDTPTEAPIQVGTDLYGVAQGGALGGGLVYRLRRLPSASVSADAFVSEGSGSLDVEVTLSTTWSEVVTLAYATAPGTAVAGIDYATSSGILSFAPGETSKTVTIMLRDDHIHEADETFFVVIDAETNATVMRGQAMITIIDDDPLPAVIVRDLRVREGNVGSRQARFLIRLSALSSASVTVQYATVPGSAVAPDDYAPVSGTLTFPAGTRFGAIAIEIVGDQTPEPNEAFFLALSAPTNATLARPQGRCTIVNDDN